MDYREGLVTTQPQFEQAEAALALSEVWSCVDMYGTAEVIVG